SVRGVEAIISDWHERDADNPVCMLEHAASPGKITCFTGASSEDSACLRAGNQIEDCGVCNEETSCGLSQSGDCWRPESLRGRTIQFSLRDGGGFREVRNEAAGAGV